MITRERSWPGRPLTSALIMGLGMTAAWGASAQGAPCEGWQIERVGAHVVASRGEWTARGMALEDRGGACVLAGEARLVGSRYYVSAAALELGAGRVSARDSALYGGQARWSAERLSVWLEDGRVELEGVNAWRGEADEEVGAEVSR